MSQPKYSRGRRLVRLLGLGRNPLCRPVDRLDGAYRLVAAFATLVVLVVSVWFGLGTYHQLLGRVEAQRAALKLVPVTLLADPPSSRTANGSVSPAPTPSVQGKWTLPDGTVRTGGVYSPVSARRGSTVQVWMNSGYTPVQPPAQDAELQFRAMVNALGAISLLSMLVWGTFGWAHGRLNRRRDAEWARDWMLFERQWRHRSH